MRHETHSIRDGTLGFMGGVDAGRNPSLLGESSVSLAVNTTMRGGYCSSRPSWHRLSLSFPNADMAQWWATARFQGSGDYEPVAGSAVVIASIGGRIFQVRIDSLSVSEITPTLATATNADFTVPAVDGEVAVAVQDADKILVGLPLLISGERFVVRAKTANVITCQNRTATPASSVLSGAPVVFLQPNASNRDHIWTEQAENFLILQDGKSKAIIYDGSSVRRAQEQEVPVGTVMAYGRGRLWVAINDYEFVAGDIAGGPTGPLSFTENDYLNEGGAFRVRSNTGPITAMRFVANLDTSLGQGPLQVFTRKAIYSVDAPTSRDQWKNVTDPIQTISLIQAGATSQNSTVLVNGDVFFRAKDGLRSFVIARREFGTWGNVPISREIHPFIRRDTRRLLSSASAIEFENRLIFTISPISSSAGVVHPALGVLDFDLISSMGLKSPPVYDGIWTGLDVLQLISAEVNEESRAFAFVHSNDGVELWELSTDGRFDNDDGRIESILDLRSYSFRDPLELKRIEDLELFVDRIAGQVEFTVYFRPDQHPVWTEWGQRSLTAQYQDCDAITNACKTPTEFKEAFQSPLAFGQPPDRIDEISGKPMRCGYEFQIRIKWLGHAQVRRVVAHALRIPERPHYPPELNP